MTYFHQVRHVAAFEGFEIRHIAISEAVCGAGAGIGDNFLAKDSAIASVDHGLGPAL